MARPRRIAPGGLIYHVLNRGNSRRRIFETPGDYAAFEQILDEVKERVPMRILAWCLMPNHWHLVLWPRMDEDLSNYMRLVTLIHTQRWHANRESAGTGHLYQGRFKSFVVQDDTYFLSVCRYVESNALRAGLVMRAQDWRWSSLSRPCDEWPVPRPEAWLEFVNETLPAAALDEIRTCAQRGAPLGRPQWAGAIADRLGLQSTMRRRGRPLVAEKGS